MPEDLVEDIKVNVGRYYRNIEKHISELKGQPDFNKSPEAMRAVSVALTELQTSHMWFNKSLYSKEQ